MSLPTLLPLVAAIIYASGALLVKRAADLGVGVWRTAFVANIVGALVFQPLLLLGGTIHPHLWWQPAIVGLCFTVGQWFTFTAMDKGDVSLATPVLGLKILFVAGLVTLFGGQTLRPALWVAALLATLGIVLLNRRGEHMAHHHIGRTIAMSGLAAFAFAIFDVLVQKWAPAWGTGRFVPLAMGAAGLFSFAFVPRFRAPLSAISGQTWAWLLAGTITMAAQSVMFVSTISQWGNAASANVVYSSRGLWSVVLVWLVGHWVKSREQHLGRSIIAWRLGGATLMLSAICMVAL
ncbi:MAG: DMT family transporter [Verrucomicrobiota bacterium]